MKPVLFAGYRFGRHCIDGIPLMSDSVASRRYQQRHIEPGLPRLPRGKPQWQHVLVIPAYRESADLVQRLTLLSNSDTSFVAILVLNRPDSDPQQQANEALRACVNTLPPYRALPELANSYALAPNCCLYLHDTESLLGPLPAGKAVGMARKIGCDIAWQWIIDGAVASDWIYSSDADAQLPGDYFERLDNGPPDAVAATYPFVHVPGQDPACNAATTLYELRLHHYVLGLEYADSPYAHHSLGSCLAVRAEAYARVRGFPQRAAGEDFYLLNKLAKLGSISSLPGECIQLQSRQSHRVPFGTGPAVTRIMQADAAGDTALFYHPQCFVALRALLRVIPQLYATPVATLAEQLRAQTSEESLALNSEQALLDMGLEEALQHCRRQGKSPRQYLRHFHQWFDAFRTLKFIHALRDAGLPQLSLSELASQQPRLWPGDSATHEASPLRGAIQEHWHWSMRDSEHW